MGTNTTQTLSGDRLIGELGRVIEKQKPKENLMPDEDIVFMTPKIPTTLDNDDFETKKKLRSKKIKKINDKIDLQRLLDKINSGHTPSELEFYFGGPNRNFFLIYLGLNLNRDNLDFIIFLSSNIGSQIFSENMLLIHIETCQYFL